MGPFYLVNSEWAKTILNLQKQQIRILYKIRKEKKIREMKRTRKVRYRLRQTEKQNDLNKMISLLVCKQ